jgi:hypothetical protein
MKISMYQEPLGESTMLENLLAQFRKVKSAYRELYADLSMLNKRVQTTRSPEDLADYAIVCRETAKLLSDLDKEYRKTQEMCERLGCMIAVTQGDVDIIRAKLCTGTPDLKMIATLPSQKLDPENYAKFMKSLGVSEELYETGVMQLYWPRVVDYLTKLAENGKPMPAGIDMEKTRPQYRLMLRLKKGVELDEIDVLDTQNVKD